MQFTAHANPQETACRALADLAPENPFATHAYVLSRQADHTEPWILGCKEGADLSTGCIAFLKRGRISRTLEIPSVPAAGPIFWEGLRDFVRQQKVTSLQLDTFASPSLTLPVIGTEESRVERHEFIIPLVNRTTGLLEGMNATHRQRVHQGIKAGLQLRTSADPSHLDEHVGLMGSSMQRREARGEIVPDGFTAEAFRANLLSAFAGLYQALLENQVVSSMMGESTSRSLSVHLGNQPGRHENRRFALPRAQYPAGLRTLRNACFQPWGCDRPQRRDWRNTSATSAPRPSNLKLRYHS